MIYGYNGLDIPREGIYKDGSLIFHKVLPYNLGYGIEHVRTIADFLMLTHDTPFDLRKVYNFENFYQMLTDNFLPFFVDNTKAKIVCARYDAEGATIHVAPILVIANYAPTETKLKLIRAIRSTIKGYESSYKKTGASNSRVADYPAISNELSYFWDFANKQKNYQDITYNKNFAAMDKMIHKQEMFTAVIGMTSNRTQGYESFADGGQRDWYINNGTCYVYNHDNQQFNIIWMNTANRLMMPGTTVDSAIRATFTTTEADSRTINKESWAGGVSDGSYGVASMMLGIPYGEELHGKKSYFLFGNKIYCLGTEIFGGEGELKTVIDNRFINKKSDIDLNNSSEIKFADVSSSLNDKKENLELMFNGDMTDGLANNKIGSWIQFELPEMTSIGGVAIAFSKGDQRKSMFDLQVSEDGTNFKDVGTYASSGKTLNFEFFEAKGDGKYIRIISRGNSSAYPEWFWIQEIRAYKGNVNKEELIKSFDVPLYGYDTIKMEGQEIEPIFNNPKEYASKNAFLDGFGGYAILDENKLTLNREFINGNTFAEFYINHGKGDKQSSYAYAILPGFSNDEVLEFSSNPGLEIISNTGDFQAIKELNTGMIGAVVYTKGKIDDFQFNTPCIALINTEENQIYLSDPTHSLDEIELVLPKRYSVKKSSNIKTTKDGITVDISNHTGDTTLIEYELADDNNPIKTFDCIIRMSGSCISSKLYANYNGKSLKYQIVSEQKYGRAYLVGDLLYYYVDDETFDEEKIKIKASGIDGESNTFYVILKK